MTVHNSRLTPPAGQTVWERRWQILSRSTAWPTILVGLGSFSSVVYPHAPLVGFAIAAGTTLPWRRGVLLITLVWLANQILGFGLRGYPLTVEAFTWGALMLLGSWVVVMLGALRPGFSRQSWVAHLGWMALSLGLGFGLYQGTIALGGWLMGSTHSLPPAILLKLFSKELVATAIAATVYSLLARRLARRSPQLATPTGLEDHA